MSVGKCRLYLWESKQQERLLKQVRMCGAEDRTRTDTGFLPADFKFDIRLNLYVRWCRGNNRVCGNPHAIGMLSVTFYLF